MSYQGNIYSSNEESKNFVIHPNGKFFYTYTESDHTIRTYKIHPCNGTSSSVQLISLYFDESEKPDCIDEILVSKEGNLLYCYDCQHNVINIFKISPDKGILTLTHHY